MNTLDLLFRITPQRGSEEKLSLGARIEQAKALHW